MDAEFRPVEEPEPSEYNEGWRLWVAIGAAAVLLAILATVLAPLVEVAG